MNENAYSTSHEKAESYSPNSQERNRSWWEQLPMTYADWESEDRVPRTRDDFERINRAYLDVNLWLKEHFDFKALSGKRVLEIGCGVGSAACILAMAGSQVTAIDLTEKAAEIARENTRIQGLNSIAIFRMDAERMEFANNSFDYAYSWGVVHHSNAPEQIIAEIARVLRPGGRGLIMVYNRHSLRYWLKGIYWLLVKRKLFAGESLTSVQRFFTDGYFQKHYTARELRQLLARLGLSDLRVSVTHMAKQMIPGLPRALDEMLKRRYGWLLIVEFCKR
jgi:2-polyprenyl-3-methyl-5-hydroxy-6-metoxy-1,4-benzoquinol methylase